MRGALDDYEKQTEMNMGAFATSRGINATTFCEIRRKGFPSTWEECQGTVTSGQAGSDKAFLKKRDAFIETNIDSDLGKPLLKKFKAEFPEFTNNQRSQKMRNIRNEIKKRIAARNQLAAAASSITADESDSDSDDQDFD